MTRMEGKMEKMENKWKLWKLGNRGSAPRRSLVGLNIPQFLLFYPAAWALLRTIV